MTEKMLLNVRDVSQLLGLSERTIWKLSQCGELPAPVHIGRSVRWCKATLEEFIVRRQEAAEAETKKRLGRVGALEKE